MNRADLLNHHKELTAQALAIMEVKNHDYAGRGGESPFANFLRCEAMGVCSTEQGFLVRIIDKISRLSTFVEAGKLMVKNEGYRDAILDIINYCILFSAYMKDKEQSVPAPSTTKTP